MLVYVSKHSSDSLFAIWLTSACLNTSHISQSSNTSYVRLCFLADGRTKLNGIREELNRWQEYYGEVCNISMTVTDCALNGITE